MTIERQAWTVPIKRRQHPLWSQMACSGLAGMEGTARGNAFDSDRTASTGSCIAWAIPVRLFSSPATWKWHWLAWEVLFPLLLPVAMSAVFVLLWEIGPSPVKLSLAIVFDLTPWTLTFFAITLLATSLRRLQAQAGQQAQSGRPAQLTLGFWALIGQAFIAAIVFANFVIWRHSAHYEPTPAAYSLSIVIVALAVRTCHAVG